MFIGREKELETLERKIESNQFEFGIVYGRRRIGKTRLLQEITKKYNAIYYVANEMGLTYNLKQLSHTITSFSMNLLHLILLSPYSNILQRKVKMKESLS